MEYIYSRVSTDKQENENQLFKLKQLYPQAVVVEEVVSGALEKPILKALLARLTSGDTLVVAALDRLGRSAGKAIQLIDELHRRKVNLVSVREGLDYSTPAGKLVSQILLSVAEMERTLISERTKAALARKKAQGVKLGPPRKYSLQDQLKVKELRAKGLKIRNISSITNISTGYVCKILKQGSLG